MPRHIAFYSCNICGTGFSNSSDAIRCELKHIVESDGHDLDKIGATSSVFSGLFNKYNTVCNFCKHSYLVYGCELNCSKKECNFWNNYKDYIYDRERTLQIAKGLMINEDNQV